MFVLAAELVDRISVGDGNFGEQVGSTAGLLVVLLGLDLAAMAFLVGGALQLRTAKAVGLWVFGSAMFAEVVGVLGVLWSALLPHDMDAPDQLWWIAGFHVVLIVVAGVQAVRALRRRAATRSP